MLFLAAGIRSSTLHTDLHHSQGQRRVFPNLCFADICQVPADIATPSPKAARSKTTTPSPKGATATKAIASTKASPSHCTKAGCIVPKWGVHVCNLQSDACCTVVVCSGVAALREPLAIALTGLHSLLKTPATSGQTALQKIAARPLINTKFGIMRSQCALNMASCPGEPC